MLRIPEGTDLGSCRLCQCVDAVFADGTPLSEMMCGEPRPMPERGKELRLIIGGDRDTFITCSVTPLGQQREGRVLTLRDVTARKRMEQERAEMNKQLLELSRRAGMAEVASDVLHNVGNVLNSVNVSCSVALDTAKSSKSVGVSRLAGLLREHRDALPEFLTNNPAGSKVPEYLAQLGEEIDRERSRLVRELEALQRSTEHIREIVATQQTTAKVAGIRDLEDAATMMDEALRVTRPSLAKHAVRVIRCFSPAPPVNVERHQVLQVLINLINNAKEAMAGVPEEDRAITARTALESGRVVLQIIDRGCGVPPENLTRIFSHGFTTRKDGHGFGLHSAALAAKTMGGRVHVESRGAGHGATFTLELPPAETAKKEAA